MEAIRSEECARVILEGSPAEQVAWQKNLAETYVPANFKLLFDYSRDWHADCILTGIAHVSFFPLFPDFLLRVFLARDCTREFFVFFSCVYSAGILTGITHVGFFFLPFPDFYPTCY
jgi:hypothetical protein